MKKPSKILYFGKKALAFLLSVLVLSLAVFYVSRLAPGDPLVSSSRMSCFVIAHLPPAA